MENYSRFFALFNKLPLYGDRDTFKESLVMQFTSNRTSSLREMSADEYNACCSSLERMTGWNDKIKKERSSALRLMQKLGVNTSDWPTVDNFCLNPRIAGKRFAQISLDGLVALQKKLRAIDKNGGLKKKQEPEQDNDTAGCDTHLVYIPTVRGEA